MVPFAYVMVMVDDLDFGWVITYFQTTKTSPESPHRLPPLLQLRVQRLLSQTLHPETMSEKQYIKNRRIDDLATAPTPQNTPATASTLPTPASQAPSIPTIKEEDGTFLTLLLVHKRGRQYVLY
jgi:hypothetical protein